MFEKVKKIDKRRKFKNLSGEKKKNWILLKETERGGGRREWGGGGRERDGEGEWEREI